jgi:hypothetical protein
MTGQDDNCFGRTSHHQVLNTRKYNKNTRPDDGLADMAETIVVLLYH